MKRKYKKNDNRCSSKGRRHGRDRHSENRRPPTFSELPDDVFARTRDPGAGRGPPTTANRSTNANNNQQSPSELPPPRSLYSSRIGDVSQTVEKRWVRSEGKIVRETRRSRVQKVNSGSGYKKFYSVELYYPGESTTSPEMEADPGADTDIDTDTETALDSVSVSSTGLDSDTDAEQDNGATQTQADESMGDTKPSTASPGEESATEASSSIEGKAQRLHIRGGWGPWDKSNHARLEDDERVPTWIWFMSSARPGHPPPTGAQLRTWKEKSQGNWPEGQKRGFFAEFMFVLTRGRYCRHHPGCKPGKKDAGAEG